MVLVSELVSEWVLVVLVVLMVLVTEASLSSLAHTLYTDQNFSSSQYTCGDECVRVSVWG